LTSHGARAPRVNGAIRVPGDKSISHRALILGLLAVGKTRISGLLEGEDVLHTANAVSALGARVEALGGGEWRVQGTGIGTVLSPQGPLDFGNAGTGSRLMMGVAASHPIIARFDGDASLRKRPMGRILAPLVRMGARVIEAAPGDRLPIVLQGAEAARPILHETPVPSAQIKSAVLLAGLNAPGETCVIEHEASRDHTEILLRYFGADLRTEPHGPHGRKITVIGQPELVPRPIEVPGDPSSAAFLIVAALLVPGSDLVIREVMMNPLRIGLVTTLLEMGAEITLMNARERGGERIADIRVRHGALEGIDVPAGRAPSMIDEYPILSIAAAFAKGETRMRGLGELRVKESDRLAAIAAGLAANGVECRIEGDDLIVAGGCVSGGGHVATHMDHRIAMSFLILGLASERGSSVDDTRFIATSFPEFFPLMARLGAEFG